MRKIKETRERCRFNLIEKPSKSRKRQYEAEVQKAEQSRHDPNRTIHSLCCVDLRLSEKLKDRDYRRKFFPADCSARIAAQIIALRNRRGLDQQQVAELIGARQTAISRVENADYQNWNF